MYCYDHPKPIHLSGGQEYYLLNDTPPGYSAPSLIRYRISNIETAEEGVIHNPSFSYDNRFEVIKASIYNPRHLTFEYQLSRPFSESPVSFVVDKKIDVGDPAVIYIWQDRKQYPSVPI